MGRFLLKVSLGNSSAAAGTTTQLKEVRHECLLAKHLILAARLANWLLVRFSASPGSVVPKRPIEHKLCNGRFSPVVVSAFPVGGKGNCCAKAISH